MSEQERTPLGPLGLALLSSTVGTICVGLIFRHSVSQQTHSKRSMSILISNTVRSACALLWPSVLLLSVPSEDVSRPALCLPVAWGFFAWAVDSYLVNRAPSSTEGRPASLRFDPSSINALSFGLCGMVGARPQSAHSALFLRAIVGSILVVLPSHNIAPGSVEEQVFDSVQKGILLWCVGLLLAGVVLAPRKPEN